MKRSILAALASALAFSCTTALGNTDPAHDALIKNPHAIRSIDVQILDKASGKPLHTFLLTGLEGGPKVSASVTRNETYLKQYSVSSDAGIAEGEALLGTYETGVLLRASFGNQSDVAFFYSACKLIKLHTTEKGAQVIQAPETSCEEWEGTIKAGQRYDVGQTVLVFQDAASGKRAL